MDQLRLFVGYDPDEALAFSVFAHSVQRHASRPVLVAQINQDQLADVFTRPRDPAIQSTSFKMSRFLVPYLCGFKGWAIFADGDMLCRADIWELWAARDDRYAVRVVKHGELAGDAPKFLGRPQKVYPRKNWSSVMLFNCARCRALTSGYVNAADWLELHQFGWIADADVGELDPSWNHLVGVQPENPAAKLVHYTLGMPFFHGFRECEFAPEWRKERDAMMAYARSGLADAA